MADGDAAAQEDAHLSPAGELQVEEGSQGSEDTSEAAAAIGGGDEQHEQASAEQELDAFEADVGAALRSLETVVADERVFLRPSARVSALARAAAKALHDHAAGSGSAVAAGELYVDGFDAEQIWGQLELQVGPVLRRAARLVRRIGPEPTLMPPDLEEALDEQLGSSAGKAAASNSEGDEGDDDEADELAGRSDAEAPDGIGAGADEEGEDDDFELDEGRSDDAGDGEEDTNVPPAGAAQRKRKRLPGEDANLRFDEMEAYLQDAERADARQRGFDDDRPARDDDDDEEASDDEEDGLEDGDVETGSDAELAAVLEHASGLVGRKAGAGSGKTMRKKRRRQEDEDLDNSEEEEADEDAGAGGMYRDFFTDERQDVDDADEDQLEDEQDRHGVNAKGKKRRRPRQTAAAVAAAQGGDQDGGRGEDDWDGEQLFDTGEGRDGEEALEDEEEDDDEMDDAGTGDDDDDGGIRPAGQGAGEGLQAPQSKHERRQAALAARIAALEAANMAEKDWFMRGEAKAESRPLNSALGMDMDFERTLAPPPQPTEEATASLEDIIRQRIADARWDDVPRVAPPLPEKRRAVLELDDNKSGKGLGELYEEDYQKAAGFAAEDTDEPLRQEARTALRRLAAKLDALSHYSFAPRPVVEDMAIRADVPALAMEDVAPQVASEAAMQYPEEVYRPGTSGGAATVAEAELSREERRARRGAKKRSAKKHRAQKDSDKRAMAAATADGVPLGRKSEAASSAAEVEAKQRRRQGNGKKRSEFTQSAKVFGKLQDAADAAAAGVSTPAKKRVELKGAPAGLKL